MKWILDLGYIPDFGTEEQDEEYNLDVDFDNNHIVFSYGGNTIIRKSMYKINEKLDIHITRDEILNLVEKLNN